MKKVLQNKKVILTIVLMLVVTAIYAQFTEGAASTMKTKITEIGKTLYIVIYSIAALAGLIGGVTVGLAYLGDKQNAPELLKKFLTGFLIILVLGMIIHLFTGIDFS